MAAHNVAVDMSQHTDYKPKNIDVLAVYDSFSIFVPMWLEALGLCTHDQAQHAIDAGVFRLAGHYPVNTGGGQLSTGRRQGFLHIHEACIQLWNKCGKQKSLNSPPAASEVGFSLVPCCYAETKSNTHYPFDGI